MNSNFVSVELLQKVSFTIISFKNVENMFQLWYIYQMSSSSDYFLKTALFITYNISLQQYIYSVFVIIYFCIIYVYNKIFHCNNIFTRFCLLFIFVLFIFIEKYLIATIYLLCFVIIYFCIYIYNKIFHCNNIFTRFCYYLFLYYLYL